MSYFKDINPWPHQQYAVDETIRLLPTLDKPLALCSPTGGGKSQIMNALTRYGLSNSMKVNWVINRNLLIEQTIDNAQKAGLQFGVRASKFSKLRAEFKDLQISSIQTEVSRVLGNGNDLFNADMVLVDEGHLQCTGC